jgi:outer membrane protein assembly factor BamB
MFPTVAISVRDMRRWGTALAVALVGLSTSGCWLQLGAGPGRDGFNPSETSLTSANAATLHEVWSASAGSNSASAPIQNGGRVFVSDGALITAFNAGSGKQLWQKDTQFATYFPALGELALYQNRVVTPYSIAEFGGEYSFDQATGAYTDSGTVELAPYNAPAVAGNVVVSDLGQANEGGALSAIQLSPTQNGLINFWTDFSQAVPATNPMVRGSQVFVGSGTTILSFTIGTCVASAIPSYCSPTWTTDLGSRTGMPVSLSSTQLAVPLANGNVAVLDAATGALQWKAVTGAAGAQSPATDGTTMFVGSGDGKVRAFPVAGCGNPTCNATSTSTAAGAAITGQPVLAGGVVYVGTANGKLVAFDTAGSQLASLTVNAAATSVDVIEDGATVYATTSNGTVAAFRAS